MNGTSSRPGRAGPCAGDVAVNLLWCVPGDVGGSEEYLVRQLIGLADQPPVSCRRSTACPRSSTHIPSCATVYPMVTAGITGRERPRRVLAENTWLRSTNAVGRSRASRRRHGARRSAGTDRADDPRPAVPHASRVPDRDEAPVPEGGDPALDPPVECRRRAHRVRAFRRRRSVRHRSGSCRGRAARGRGRSSAIRRPSTVRPPPRRTASGPVRSSCSRRSRIRTRATASCST